MAVTSYYSINGTIRAQDVAFADRSAFLSDALGSVTATTDSRGAVLNTYRYKPYGEQLAKTGAAADPNFTWVGCAGYRDSVEFAYIRARHYSPAISSWIAMDSEWPVQLAFAYAQSSPTTYTDPTGRFTVAMRCAGINEAIIVYLKESDNVLIWVKPGGTYGKYSSIDDCMTEAKKHGDNCMCVNAGFFGGGGPIGPVTSCDGKTYPSVPLLDDKGRPKPTPEYIPVHGDKGSVMGRPVADAPDPGRKRGRTAGCVDQNGKIQIIVIFPDPPGATKDDLKKCLDSLCKSPLKPVNLDGGGSTQADVSPRKAPFPVKSSDESRKRSVHNWIIICN